MESLVGSSERCGIVRLGRIASILSKSNEMLFAAHFFRENFDIVSSLQSSYACPHVWLCDSCIEHVPETILLN